MATKAELEAYTRKTIAVERWTVEDGRVVPATKDIPFLSNYARRFAQATFLYADLKGSTKMVSELAWQRSGEIYKTYLYCASRLIRHFAGEVVAFDGDRVMGLFLGDGQESKAARCAFSINWARQFVVQPIYDAHYGAGHTIEHSIGIDTSEVRCCRTGVRGGNDLLWIGPAANIAAKLTDLKEAPIWITATTYNLLSEEMKYSNGTSMWKLWKWTPQNDRPTYSSTWHWGIV